MAATLDGIGRRRATNPTSHAGLVDGAHAAIADRLGAAAGEDA
jgi:hypothetical protein